MNDIIKKIVFELPEIYQMIYSHPEWDKAVSRNCLPRLKTITSIYDSLSLSLDRPLRVLDLGCAQGFYSLSLAEKGASVKGIDFLQQNVALCRALANEHPTFNVTFFEEKIEKSIEELEYDQFDLVIGMSVFHHLVYTHGIDKVQQLITKLLNRIEIVVLELALKEEPTYWGPSQPDSPIILFEHSAFYQQIAEHSTHLSSIARPLYVLSNRRILLGEFCKPFIRWSKQPYSQSENAHHNSRRYYFGDNYFCKVYYTNVKDCALSEKERERNWRELHQEIDFLSHAPSGFPVAHLLANGKNKWQGWNVLSYLPGELLSNKLLTLTSTEQENILSQILQQLAKLERSGFYHDDIRTWNILVDENLQVYIIDYGSISDKKTDCTWPENLFLSFFIILNEIISPTTFNLSNRSSFLLSPLNLPTPYSQWLYAFCQYKPQEWSFALLLMLFKRKVALPIPLDVCNGIEIWIAACEGWLLQRERYNHHLYQEHKQAQNQIINEIRKDIEIRFNRLYEDITVNMEQWKELKASLRTLHYRLYGNDLERNTFQDVYEADQINASSLAELSREALISYCQTARHRVCELHRKICQLQKYNRVPLENRFLYLTSLYRYVGLQIRLLQQHGMKRRAKHILERFKRSTLIFLQRHPGLKSSVITLLHKSGQYKRFKRIHHSIIPRPQQDIIFNQQKLQAWSLQDPQHRLPPIVNNLFNKLRAK